MCKRPLNGSTPMDRLPWSDSHPPQSTPAKRDTSGNKFDLWLSFFLTTIAWERHSEEKLALDPWFKAQVLAFFLGLSLPRSLTPATSQNLEVRILKLLASHNWKERRQIWTKSPNISPCSNSLLIYTPNAKISLLALPALSKGWQSRHSNLDSVT